MYLITIIPTLKKRGITIIKIKKTKKKKQHKNKNKTEAGLDGLFLWLGLNPFLRKLSKSGLKVVVALTEGNSLNGLNKES